ncbi:uncharacterized protein LOC127136866 [Lathyrus oleraceus]|uniref:uncharacterized protein LOC127136866 n=1 Tax=Pisum sativum TaxID=3888 RepID=UPI0021D02CAA|nr:uncharacterized protein LOC127136866 [Pisum sativum]
MNLEKHEKKENKEKTKDTEKKSITLKASSSKSSTNDTRESESSDNDTDSDEDMGLFVRRRQSKFSNQEERKATKSRGLCYNCGKADHYKPDYPLLKKDKGKDKHHKKSSKDRRAYIAWESDIEPLSNGNSSDEEEKLQKAFSTLHNEAKEAFKRLASNKKIFWYLEKKISDSKKELETLKKSMIEATKGKTEDDMGFWFRWA